MIRLARVTAVHPQRRQVDIVFLDDATRAANVAVMHGSASSDAGSWNVPSVPLPNSEATAAGIASSGRAMTAAVIMAGNRFVVLGFVSNQLPQVAFTEQDRTLHRHPSGSYATVAPDGSMEAYHPGGAYLRIGTGDHQDMTPLAANGNWTLPAGVAAPVITLNTPGFKLTASPGAGGTVITVQGDVTIQATDATISTSGNATVSATGTATVTGASVVLGAGGKRVVVDGDPVTTGGSVTATQSRVTAG